MNKSAGFSLRLLAHILVTSVSAKSIEKYVPEMGKYLVSSFSKVEIIDSCELRTSSEC